MHPKFVLFDKKAPTCFEFQFSVIFYLLYKILNIFCAKIVVSLNFCGFQKYSQNSVNTCIFGIINFGQPTALKSDQSAGIWP